MESLALLIGRAPHGSETSPYMEISSPSPPLAPIRLNQSPRRPTEEESVYLPDQPIPFESVWQLVTHSPATRMDRVWSQPPYREELSHIALASYCTYSLPTQLTPSG